MLSKTFIILTLFFLAVVGSSAYSRQAAKGSHAFEKESPHENHHRFRRRHSGTSNKDPITNKFQHNHSKFTTSHSPIKATPDKLSKGDRRNAKLSDGAHVHKRKVKPIPASSSFTKFSQKSQSNRTPMDSNPFQASDDWGPKVKPVHVNHDKSHLRKIHHKPRNHIRSSVARLPRTEPESEGFFASTWRKITNLFEGTESTTETSTTSTTTSAGVVVAENVKTTKQTWIIAKPHTKKIRSENKKRRKYKSKTLGNRHHHKHKSNHKTPIIRKRKSFHDLTGHFVQKRVENIGNNTQESTKNDSNTGVLASAWNNLRNFFIPTTANASTASDNATIDDTVWTASSIITNLPPNSYNFTTEVNGAVKKASEVTRNKRFGSESTDDSNLWSASENASEPTVNDINVILMHNRFPILHENENKEQKDVHDIQNRQKDSPKGNAKGLKLSKVIVKTVRQDIRETVQVYDVKNSRLQENDLSKLHKEESEDYEHIPNILKIGNKQMDSSLISDISLPNTEFSDQKGTVSNSKVLINGDGSVVQFGKNRFLPENTAMSYIIKQPRKENTFIYSSSFPDISLPNTKLLDQNGDVNNAKVLVKGDSSDSQYGQNQIPLKNTSMKYKINSPEKDIAPVKFRDKERVTPSRSYPNVLSNLIQTENSFVTTTLKYAFKDGNGTGLIIVSSQEDTKKAQNLLTSDQKLEAIVEETNISKEEMTKYLRAKNDDKENSNIKKKSLIKARNSPENENEYFNASIGNFTFSETPEASTQIMSMWPKNGTEIPSSFTSENFTNPPTVIINTLPDTSLNYSKPTRIDSPFSTSVTNEAKNISDVNSSENSTKNELLNNTGPSHTPFPITSIPTLASNISEAFKGNISTSEIPKNDSVRGKRDRVFNHSSFLRRRGTSKKMIKSIKSIQASAENRKLKANKKLKLRNIEVRDSDNDEESTTEENKTFSHYTFVYEDFMSTTNVPTEYFTSDSDFAEKDTHSVYEDHE